MIELKHPFLNKMPDVEEFFRCENEAGVVNTVNGLCDRIKTLSEKYAIQIDPNDFKGWALELFVEYLIKSEGHDNRIGIYDYVPITSDDTGADGYGKGDNTHPATVQVKFRRGDWILTANDDHLSNFLTASLIKYGVKIDDDRNMLIVTTGLKVADETREKMLYGKVRVLNREALREMLDNRPEWWLRFRDAVKAGRAVLTPQVRIDLRPSQLEAVASMEDKTQGVIIRPTGTGKTCIIAEKICRVIREEQAKGNLPVIKVNSPRIILNFQLFEDIFQYLNSHGVTARYVNFCSGDTDDEMYCKVLRQSGQAYREITDTTSPQAVKAEWEKSRLENIPLIIISTYHSSEKFAQAGITPTCTFHDEAHHLVSEEFEKCAWLPSGADFFFTATPKLTDSPLDLGMNNIDRFGPRLHTRSPKQMILLGEMIPPMVHVVSTGVAAKGVGDTDYATMFRSIADAFFRHQERIKQDSASPDEIGAKVLVVCRGQKDLREMEAGFAAFRLVHPEVHVFALSTDFGIYDDGEKTRKPVTCKKKIKFLQKIKALTPIDQCLIFHVDMLTEGIDVQGITGVMPFRNCETIPFLQNVGRASRLHAIDRRRLYAGEITPTDRRAWVKRCSWLIIPSYLENAVGFEDRFKSIIGTLRTEFGFVPEQHTLIDNLRGVSEDEPIDTTNEKTKNQPRTDSGVKDFAHDFEDVSMVERVIFGDDIATEAEKIRGEFAAAMAPKAEAVQPIIPVEADKESAILLEVVEAKAVQTAEIVAPLVPILPTPVAETPVVPETPKAPRKSGGLGRAATEVGDPVEVAEIKAAYKGNGGTLSFKQIEAEPRFNLRAAHGSTAYRIIKR